MVFTITYIKAMERNTMNRPPSVSSKGLCIPSQVFLYTVKHSYNVMKGTEYFVVINECCSN
jgi:hypothetical protein